MPKLPWDYHSDLAPERLQLIAKMLRDTRARASVPHASEPGALRGAIALRILRLCVADFAAVSKAEIDFGPGLNVLYGPNDLGKSTLADAIRLALLLPINSTQIGEYVPWSGGRDPVVEMTFETEPQRIWRVRRVASSCDSSSRTFVSAFLYSG